MSKLIFDSNNNEYSRDSIILSKNAEKVINIKIKCLLHYFLKIDAQPSGAFISGRIAGSGSYIDLADGIDLSAFNGQTKSFEIKIQTFSPAARYSKLPVQLRISFNGN